ncbi:MAG: carbohydrate-binding protein [Microcoleaceae cyanobacterium]
MDSQVLLTQDSLLGDSLGNPIRIEAEEMELDNYRLESTSFASNDALISFLNGSSDETGTATETLTAVSGFYDLVVSYVEENDGEAQLEVKLNGESLDSWVLDRDVTADRPADDNFLRRTVAEDLSIQPGDQLEISGIEVGTEHARVDYVELIPVAAPEPEPGQAIRIEAEDYREGDSGIAYFDTTPGNTGKQYRSDDVDIQWTADVDGGFNVGWIREGEWLTYDVNVPEAGEYDLVARVASDWNLDHQLQYSLGEQQGLFEFNGTGGWQNWTDVKIADVALESGQQILRLDALSHKFNINYIDLIPVAATEPTPEPQPILIEAESMELTNYRTESTAFASDGSLISLRGGNSGETGTATQTLVEADGFYNLIVNYVEESDGESQLEVKLNGESLDSWILDQEVDADRPASDNLFSRTVAENILVQPGDELEILGIEEGGEYARVDYIELVPVASTEPEPTPEPEPEPSPEPYPTPEPTP